MSITHAHTSAKWTLGSSVALALALALPAHAHAADAPAPDAPATAEPKPKQAKPKAKAKPKPRASSRGSLDATARRALRASSARANDSLEGERVAMRTVAPAADDDPPNRGKSKKKPKRSASKDDDAGASSDASDRRISLDEDFLVEGKLEKPNAFYILRRSQSGYDWARLDAKFLPLVLESVQDPLF